MQANNGEGVDFGRRRTQASGPSIQLRLWKGQEELLMIKKGSDCMSTCYVRSSQLKKEDNVTKRGRSHHMAVFGCQHCEKFLSRRRGHLIRGHLSWPEAVPGQASKLG